MPCSIMRITKQDDSFICSVYSMVEDIPHKPIDIWECSEIIPDPDTMIWLNDRRLLEAFHARIAKWEGELKGGK